MGTAQLRNYIPFEVSGSEYLFHGLSGNIVQLDHLSREFVRYAEQNGTRSGDTVELDVDEYLAQVGADAAPRHRQMLAELSRLEILDLAETELKRFTATPPVPASTEGLPVKTLVFHLANACNLRCTYCYAGDGEYGAPQKYMSIETAERAIRFLLENSFDEKSVTIVLFGGEPFLNWKVLKHIVEHAVEEAKRWGKTVTFSLTTNGTLMTEEQMVFLHKYKIGTSVSMDGTKAAHDRNRPMAGGQGSYDRTSQNVAKLLETHTTAPIGTRVTVAKGFEKLETSLEHLLAKGFYEVGFAPVTESNMELALGDDDLAELLRQFRQLAELYVEAAVNNEYLGFSNLTNLLKELHTGTNKAYGCGAGLGFFAVSPDGGLYLCHRFNENEQFKLGDIYFGLHRRRQQEVLAELHVDRKESCTFCALKHICSGGCYYEAMERQGDYRRPNAHYCSWMHDWITLGLQTYVKILEKNPAFLDRISGIGKEGCMSN
ncbi:radical SAM/SPASM domain-containing protein [Brevibacillus massiliensis]|uniref:radical SAM/SPASM domain-containing protein n=1 Tax=Brevibacillus massiliensis TaxID=1118054 RepID=UPI0002E68CF9|nr:SPASM domain-containing protein [Brevibacillus massiliensis]